MISINLKKIFNGSPNEDYPDGIRYHLTVAKRAFSGKPSITRYGRFHPEEAWAEAFSHTLCNVEDYDLDANQIRQLAYVDWVVSNILSKRRSWGKYKDFTVDVTCAECGETLVFGPCRIDLDVSGWEVNCPYCEEDLIF